MYCNYLCCQSIFTMTTYGTLPSLPLQPLTRFIVSSSTPISVCACYYFSSTSEVLLSVAFLHKLSCLHTSTHTVLIHFHYNHSTLLAAGVSSGSIQVVLHAFVQSQLCALALQICHLNRVYIVAPHIWLQTRGKTSHLLNLS